MNLALTNSKKPANDEHAAWNINYVTVTSKAAMHLIDEISPTGYISAAPNYSWYKPHWFRDSSWVAIALLTYYNSMRKDDTLAISALSAADKVINFNIEGIRKFLGRISKLESINYEDHEFFNLKFHMPSRCGPNHEFFKSDTIADEAESNVKHSWLMQYDSIPLILLSLRKKHELVGLSENEKDFLDKHMETILRYLGKIYITECPSMWEINADMLHAYNVAAIHSAFEFAHMLSHNRIIHLSSGSIEGIERKYFKEGTLGFLKQYFVKDGMLYSEKKPFAESPETSKGFDGSEIFVFNYFGINGKTLGDEKIEEITLQKMREELFGNNVLPIRFKGDIYFTGGRWLLLGLEFANYYAMHGSIEKAEDIIDYIEKKYSNSYPEQEIVDPASPSIDQGNYYALNNYKPIQDLAWSYASMIIAALNVESEKAKQLLRGY